MAKKPAAAFDASDAAPEENPGSGLPAELVPVSALIPHPRNYRAHPPDQLRHLVRSLEENGFYRNVVVSTDGTILAGHGIVLAAKEAGILSVPVVRLPISPEDPRALRILAGDNEVGHLAEQDDRVLSDLLKELADAGEGELLGTGYDEMMLANLVMVTRPASEIQDFDAAAAWVGMPEYEPGKDPYRLVVLAENQEEILQLIEQLGLHVAKKSQNGSIRSAWWPPRDGNEDPSSVKFTAGEEAPGESTPSESG